MNRWSWSHQLIIKYEYILWNLILIKNILKCDFIHLYVPEIPLNLDIFFFTIKDICYKINDTNDTIK